MIQKISLLSILTVLMLSDCKPSGKNNDENTALALLMAGSSQAQVTSGQLIASMTAGTGSVSSAIQGGQVAFLKTKSEKKQLIANVMKIVEKERKQKLLGSFIETALQHTGGSCTTTSCNTILNGTASCGGILNQGSGTLTANNLQVTLSQSGTTSSLPLTVNFTANGGLTLNNCTTMTRDWINYPKYVTTTASGDLTLNDSEQYVYSTISLANFPQTTIGSLAVSSTVSSTNLSLNGGAPTVSKIAYNANVNFNTQVTAGTSTVTYNSTTNKYSGTFTMSVTDVLTGSISATGSVNGSPVNVSKTFSNTTTSYVVFCDLSTFTCSVK
ncbi:hypothetical protein EHO60_03300 [Leptospira fletcheri]|uniref:Uncharacterized protein n=1 Tax=Leptospira fletcheri TaxID=2484981 RepID=A0A4V3JDZ9_9LEPT|nr:hypothetical protein [Leptospira fletcheri]TGK12912.1 hypothetical protein EHO60_03300 [Leptospira fletcheri]